MEDKDSGEIWQLFQAVKESSNKIQPLVELAEEIKVIEELHGWLDANCPGDYYRCRPLWYVNRGNGLFRPYLLNIELKRESRNAVPPKGGGVETRSAMPVRGAAQDVHIGPCQRDHG